MRRYTCEGVYERVYEGVYEGVCEGVYVPPPVESPLAKGTAGTSARVLLVLWVKNSQEMSGSYTNASSMATRLSRLSRSTRITRSQVSR